MSERRQKGVVFSVRFTAVELALLQEAAGREGCTISTFIHNAAMCAELRARPNARVVHDARTGAEVVTAVRVTDYRRAGPGEDYQEEQGDA